MRSGSGKISSFLKRGSVCALKGDPEIILIADFCSLKGQCHEKSFQTETVGA